MGFARTHKPLRTSICLYRLVRIFYLLRWNYVRRLCVLDKFAYLRLLMDIFACDSFLVYPCAFPNASCFIAYLVLVTHTGLVSTSTCYLSYSLTSLCCNDDHLYTILY